MYDFKIHYHCRAKATSNEAFEAEIFKLAEKFGLEFKRSYFDSADWIKVIYFRKK